MLQLSIKFRELLTIEQTFAGTGVHLNVVGNAGMRRELREFVKEWSVLCGAERPRMEVRRGRKANYHAINFLKFVHVNTR